MGFTYKFVGIEDNKNLYVGQTKFDTTAKRWKQELKELMKGESFNSIKEHPLVIEWKKRNGFEGIRLEILEEIDTDETKEYFDRLNESEIYWIKELKTHASEGGCNLTRGGQDSFVSWETEQRVKKQKETIKEFRRLNGRNPSQYIPEERKLWTSMASYISPSSKSFDSDFLEQLEAIPITTKLYKDNVEENQETIKEFRRLNGRNPSQYIPEERKLWKAMASYISPSSDSFDSVFREELDSIYATNVLYKDKALMIYAFINTFNRLPKADWEIKGEYNVYMAYLEYFGKIPTKSKEEIQALKDRIDTILN